MKSKWIDWDDKEFLQSILDRSTSKVDAIRNMGYSPRASTTKRKLNEAIDRLNLDTSNFINDPQKWNKLAEIVPRCYSASQVLRELGMRDVGGNLATVRKRIDEAGLDTSHFNPFGNGMPKVKATHESIFCENSSVTKATLRRRVLDEDLVVYECASCGLKPFWNGVELVLQLDHINGNGSDNRLNNLQFLCPNCHTQTKTWGAKKRA